MENQNLSCKVKKTLLKSPKSTYRSYQLIFPLPYCPLTIDDHPWKGYPNSLAISYMVSILQLTLQRVSSIINGFTSMGRRPPINRYQSICAYCTSLHIFIPRFDSRSYINIQKQFFNHHKFIKLEFLSLTKIYHKNH